MIECDLPVVGGGAAGAAALHGFRRHHGRGDVVPASTEHVLLLLSKQFLRGAEDVEDLPVEATDFYGGVDLRLGNPVGDRTLTCLGTDRTGYPHGTGLSHR